MGINKPVVFLTLAFLIIVCHGLSLNAEFMTDDFYYRQPEKIALHYKQFSDFFIKSPGHHYNPFDVIINVFLFQIFSKPIFLYAINLVLFYGNALLLFFLAAKLFCDQRVAFLTAILFAVHPVNAENLSHITFNSVYISALFLQSSMILFLNNRFYLSLISFIPSLFFLETALLFPICLSLTCLLKKDSSRREHVAKTFPFWMTSFAYFILWFFMTGSAIQFEEKIAHLNFAWGKYLATSALLLQWYIGNLFSPDTLVFIKSSALLSQHLVFWVLGLAFALLGIVIFIGKFSTPQKTVALLWFLVGFIYVIPASTIHAYTMGLVIEPHWFFFSSMGFFMLIALFLRDAQKHIRPILYHLLLGTIILFWGITSYRHHLIAKSEISYLEYWLKISPGNHTPALRLGNLYGLNKDLYIPNELIIEMERQADFFIQAKQYPQATALIQKIILSSPSKAFPWEYTLTAIAIRQGEIPFNPNQINGALTDYIIFAKELERLGLHREAEGVIDNGLNNYPQNADLAYVKALILANQDRFLEAESILAPYSQNSKISDFIHEIQKLRKKQ